MQKYDENFLCYRDKVDEIKMKLRFKNDQLNFNLI